MSATTPPGDVTQRAAILGRLRELLGLQNERFRRYIIVLEKQTVLIGSGSGDDILALVEHEERIVAEILSIQKTIDPLEKMYRGGDMAFPDDITALKTEHEDLVNRVKTTTERNRCLLSARLADIRAGINVLRLNPLRSQYHNVYAASLIDVEG